ncbi:hypothetical protein RUND412_002727 [Rhizina undulata]
MKAAFSFVSILSAISVAVAQQNYTAVYCALKCVSQFSSEVGCTAADFNCLCAPSFGNNTTPGFDACLNQCPQTTPTINVPENGIINSTEICIQTLVNATDALTSPSSSATTTNVTGAAPSQSATTRNLTGSPTPSATTQHSMGMKLNVGSAVLVGVFVAGFTLFGL